ncbi:tRNA (guanosine(46)-N7)-methyltransferase TrmB [Bacillus chungangensis]|uniref:tRNA (guanine-N(7)-)-methyltransferase n=1 Tax=Bacillus chungangensis TaxID=587633 RepID=A0ABT9WUT0_9BACI|nr:tRNA (guanosine(46)-N7)-methyltransferase TrmB [Bacillus chungangensis]MDQ0176884.1 tRNA (guanine-N7-)-methyltransferase [Bacillus chungangensis]
MRLRNKPGAKAKLQAFPQYVLQHPEQYKGKWHAVFEQQQPLHIEIGTGKGKFIIGMAEANPHINYIGIERQESVIVSALDRLVALELPNVKLLHIDGMDLKNYFKKDDVDRIYLNFSDPWPKKRHEKRRLTHHSFLSLYKDILIDKGCIHFKTDNQQLFEYSLMSFSAYGLLLTEISLDLHRSSFEGNIMTEYEEKFSQKGHRIYRCEVQYS